MNAQKRFYLILILVSVLALAGCSLPMAATPTATPAFNPIFTSAAQTMIAQMTQIAALATPVPPTQIAITQIVITQIVQPATDVPAPTEVAPTATPLPTWTPLPTNTPVPTAVPTKAPTATPTSLPCNWAQFVGDVTVADNTVFAPDMGFTKVWRLKNIGSCTWTKDYNLTYFAGDKMDAQTLYPMPVEVKPGQTVDLAVRMKAPSKAGTYLGSWQLRSSSNVLFGIGDEAKTAFWVKIKVQAMTEMGAFDLATNMCDAKWQNGLGAVLNCPGNQNDSSGFVQYLAAPKLEDGSTDDESTLWITPQRITDGQISGEYPAFTVQNGDRFRAYIGCMYNNAKCNAKLSLRYRDAGGTVHTLETWTETYDQKVNFVEVNLNSLAGQTVKFILVVETAGSAEGDSVFWLTPHIYR